MAGYSYGNIENCSVSGSVSGSGMNGFAGGVVGSQWGGSNNSHAGGVVGYNGGGTLTACYATGSVTGSGSGTIYVGGVTGSNNLGILTACYHAKGDVSGPTGTTGGVAGRNFKGSMSGGGIITACFWGSNGQTQGIGENQAGTGETTKVDGDWTDAVTQMNKALSSTGWQYESSSGNEPPMLQKVQ